MRIKLKRNIVFVIATFLLILLVIWTIWGNKAIETNHYTIISEKLGSDFDSYRIAQVSDLHNNKLGKDNEKLISTLKNTQPDIIAVTGDLIDSRNTNVEIAVDFMKKAVEIAPCYYINGNHEARVPNEYTTLKESLSDLGVIILENECIKLNHNEDTINLIGINDPDFYAIEASTIVDNNISELNRSDNYTVLLSHRPELFEVYVENKIDLSLTGHAHGGQFRLPFVGGLFAPHQGVFPKYDSGLFTQSETNMIVSRGIGNSIFPFRFNNRPEIVVVELKTE